MMKRAVVFAVIITLIATGSISAITLVEKPDKEIYEETIIDIDVLVSVRNIGLAPAFQIPLRLAIPQDREPSQYALDLVLSELPERQTNDSLGNKFIHYTIDRLEPQTAKNITISLSIKLVSIDFNIQKKNPGDFNGEFSEYLGESAFINVNEPAIIELAKDIASESNDIVDIAWNTYEWIIENIFYQQIAGEWDALTTLKNGEGGSAELGNLYVALLRANNIPARRVSGWAQNFDEGDEFQLSRFAHGWAEFYLPEFGWMQVDPTWGKSHKFERFAKTSDTHIAVTHGAGIHFLWRGPYSVQFGETDLNTDYKLVVKSTESKNLSVKRDMITFGIFMPPAMFALFIAIRKAGQRRG
jgi:hypothetical protein